MTDSEFGTEKVKWQDMTARQIMESVVSSCHTDDTCEVAADTMIKRGCGSLPVVADEDLLVGIISEYDLLKILQNGKKLADEKVQDQMTKTVMSVEPNSTVRDIIDLLENRHLIRVPVAENGKVVGMVTRRDVLYAEMKSKTKD